MKSNEISLREGRAQLGALAERAHHGETIILTKHGRPYVRLAPLETPVPTPQIAVADLRALLSGTSTTPVLYVDHESDERELTVWDEALVSHHDIVIRKDELIEAFEATDDEVTDDDLAEAIENWRLQEKVDAIVAKDDSTQD